MLFTQVLERSVGRKPSSQNRLIQGSGSKKKKQLIAVGLAKELTKLELKDASPVLRQAVSLAQESEPSIKESMLREAGIFNLIRLA